MTTRRLQVTKDYWSEVCITAAQVFLGVAAATAFTGTLDFLRLFVILVNAVVAFIFWIIGWRIIK